MQNRYCLLITTILSTNLHKINSLIKNLRFHKRFRHDIEMHSFQWRKRDWSSKQNIVINSKFCEYSDFWIGMIKYFCNNLRLVVKIRAREHYCLRISVNISMQTEIGFTTEWDSWDFFYGLCNDLFRESGFSTNTYYSKNLPKAILREIIECRAPCTTVFHCNDT